jgi:acyl-coenzyme A synthetase/AMP-(fatty) acid ligase
VVGASDPVLGEIGVAFVVPTEGYSGDAAALLAELRTLARASLADYKAPDRVVVTDGLPLTSMMKVDKRALARWAEQANGQELVPSGRGRAAADWRQPANGAAGS